MASSVADIKKVTLTNNQAVKIVTVGNKALLCCNRKDLKTMSFRQHSSAYCAMPNCKNFRGKLPNLSFFQFPKDVGRCNTWIMFTKREDLRTKDPSILNRSGYVICADHFEDSMFMNSTVRNRLIHCAVPTISDPNCPPPPVCIKELAAQFSEPIQDKSQLSRKEEDLCHFHRKFVKAVTALEVDITDVHYCMTCGSAIQSIIEVSPTAYQVVCKRRHSMLFTTEFALKCRKWVHDCHSHHQSDKHFSPDNRCHLCDEHFAHTSGDMHSSESLSSSFPLPSAQEVTITTTLEPKVLVGGINSKIQPPEITMAFPSLPSSFFSVRGVMPHILEPIVVINPSTANEDVVAVQSLNIQTNMDCKTHREVELGKRIKVLNSRALRLKKQVEKLKKEPKMSFEFLCKELEKYLKGSCLLIVQEQLRASQYSDGVTYWSCDFLMLAKAIHKESIEAYSILRQLMKMPAGTTIQKYKNISQESPNLVDYLRTAFPDGDKTELLETEVAKCKQEIIIAEDQRENCAEEEKAVVSMEEDVPLGMVQEQDIIMETLQDGTIEQIMPSNAYEIFEIYTEETTIT